MRAEAGADLDAAQRATDLRRLLDGLVTDDSLNAVLDLLGASSPGDLQALFRNGEVPARLASVLPIRHPLHRRLERFAQDRFGISAAQLASWGRRGWQAVDLGFQPWIIDSSLTDRAHRYLDQAEFQAALQAADARGWDKTDPPQRIGEKVIRPHGLSPDAQAEARSWLARLAEAAERAEWITGHFSGDPVLLSLQQQWEVIEASLRVDSLTPWQALELLDDANDTELAEFIRRRLPDLLTTGIPSAHPLHERAEGFRARRLPGGQQMKPVVPAQPFDPGKIPPRDDQHDLEMIRPQLADLGVRTDLAPAELELVGMLIAGRTRADIASELPLNQRRQRALFDHWWKEVAEPARLIDRAREYLDGDLDVVEDDDDLHLLITSLLGSEPTARHALELLAAADDEQMVALFEDDSSSPGPRGGGLRALLERAIPAGHDERPLVDQLIGDRFEETGGVKRNFRPARPFSPAVISRDLADLRVRDELTPEQLMVAARAMTGRADDAIDRLHKLPQVQLARAIRWVHGVYEAVVDWLLGYRAGNRGYGMTAPEMRELADWLLKEPIPARAPKAVLALLEGVDDAQLAGIYDDRLRQSIDQAIPVGHGPAPPPGDPRQRSARRLRPGAKGRLSLEAVRRADQ